MMVVDDDGIDQLYVDAGIGSATASAAGSSTLAKERAAARPRALHVPGQRARPALLRAERVRRRVVRRRSAQRGAPARRPLRVAAVTLGADADAAPRRLAATATPIAVFRPATGRRSSSSTARPPTTRRGGRPARCSAARYRSTRSTGAAGAPPATAAGDAVLRSSASSTTSPRSSTRSRARRRCRSTSSATRTAGGSRSARRSGRRASRRLVVYEGAPPPAGRRGYQPAGVEARIETPHRGGRPRRGARDVHARDRRDARAGARGVPREPDLAASASRRSTRRSASSGRRARRRRRSRRSAAVGGRCSRSSAAPARRRSARRRAALDARLPNGRVVMIPGARHAAHHTHVAAFVACGRRPSSTTRTSPKD